MNRDLISELKSRDKLDFSDLCTIMKLLRGEGGCPWDREQTHKSIRKNVIEEAYEVAEAIDLDDDSLLAEELGDLILQAVFHAQISAEQESFTIEDVTTGICKKLIVRHPHIFADVVADTSDKVLTNWESIKQEQKGNKTVTQAVDSVCKALPSLMRAHKIGSKAAKAGFDFETVSDAIAKLKEEIAELEEAIKEGSAAHIDEETGDMFFAAVNVSRKLKVDAEEALTRATDKFAFRLKLLENEVLASGKTLSELTLAQMDEIWDMVKNK